jgi:hypothetical protein
MVVINRSAPSPWWFRSALALVIGTFVTAFLAGQPMSANYRAADLTILLRRVHTVMAGEPPYRTSMADPDFDDRLLYPLPAVLVMTPVAHVRPELVRAMWSGLAAVVITFIALSKFGLHGFAIVVSRCAERAFVLAQWSPWFFAGALVPPFQLLAAAKPTIAFLVWVYRPTWWPFIGAAVLVPLAFLVWPSWLGEWLATTKGVGFYAAAATVWQGGGPLLLLAALRWRRAEARLLLAMSCVPHNFVWYDQLLLFLVPATAFELWSLSALSWLSMFVAHYYFVRLGIPEPGGQVAFRAPIVALLYLPALAMVLRRPNEGTIPAWLEQVVSRRPAWLRGRSGLGTS